MTPVFDAIIKDNFFLKVDKEKVASIIAQALKKQEGTSLSSNQEEGDQQDGVTSVPANNGMNRNGSAGGQPLVQEISIEFERGGKGLGLSIAGGLGSTPYKLNDEGIFISRVTPGGPAHSAGLCKDDKVLEVNGHSCVDIDHYEAVGILKAAGSYIALKVVREIFPPSSTENGVRNSVTTPETTSLSSLSHAGSSYSQKSPAAASKPPPDSDHVLRLERIFTTLIRDPTTGLGFSISGGKGADPFIEGSDAVYISKVSENGPAAKDGKLLVGDKLVQINGVDVSEAEHIQVVEMLTGLERFVRLCVERKMEVPSSAVSSFSADGKSPKVFGVPKPYTGLYSASSYMANRPSYMRSREPGQYSLANSPSAPNNSSGSLGSYGKLPGVSGLLNSDLVKAGGNKSQTLPGSITLPEMKSEEGTSVVVAKPPSGPHHNPDATVQELIERLPSATSKMGVTTETVKRTTYTETTVKRVTNNKPKALVVEVTKSFTKKNVVYKAVLS